MVIAAQYSVHKTPIMKKIRNIFFKEDKQWNTFCIDYSNLLSLLKISADYCFQNVNVGTTEAIPHKYVCSNMKRLHRQEGR